MAKTYRNGRLAAVSGREETGSMSDDYNLAAPDPFTGSGETTERIDHTGFRAGVDRMKTAPEFLADSRGPSAAASGLGAEWVVNGQTSDGYHTFDELYDHRRALTAAMLKMALWEGSWGMRAWRSRNHHPEDSPCFEGQFIVGLHLPNIGPITYHYADQYWDDFQQVPELEHAPKWDGADAGVTVTRLLDYARG